MSRDTGPVGVVLCAWGLIAVGTIAVLDGAFGAGAGPREWALALLAVASGGGVLRRNRPAYFAAVVWLVLIGLAAVYRAAALADQESPIRAVGIAIVALAAAAGAVYLLLPRVRSRWLGSAPLADRETGE